MDSLRKKRPTKIKRNIPKSPATTRRSLHTRSPQHSTQQKTPPLPSYPPPITPPRSNQKAKPTHKIRNTLLAIIFLILLVPLTAFGYFTWRVTQASNTISADSGQKTTLFNTARELVPSLSNKNATLSLKGVEDGRINILLLGKTGKNYPGENITDTIIVASIDTKENRAALLSLPRDMYVKIPDASTYAKINTLYNYGVKNDDPLHYISKAVENITHLDLQYYVMVDYDGFTKIIDALGGIQVMVERDIYDPRYPGPNYSYQTFELQKGLQILDGETALKYVRERHSDPLGDFGRAHRQQQVLQAVKSKVLSTKTYLNPLTVNELIAALEGNVRTNIAFDEINAFASLLPNIDTQNISTVVVDAWQEESLLRVSHVYLDNGQRMFALVPRAGNYSEIQEAAETIFDKDLLEKRKQSIEEESASVAIINYSGEAQIGGKVKTLLEDLGFSSVSLLPRTSDAPLLETSAVIDLSDLQKPYSLDEIIKKIPATKSSDSLFSQYLPEQYDDIDIFLLLGKESISRYDWEEGSVEEYRQTDPFE